MRWLPDARWLANEDLLGSIHQLQGDSDVLDGTSLAGKPFTE